MRRLASLALAGVLLATLSGCGFRPMYGRAARVPADTYLAQVAVEPIAGRVGQKVWNDLLDRVSPAGTPGQPRYRLYVRITVSSNGLAVRNDARITRKNYRMVADFRLVDIAAGKEIYSGRTFAIAAYNVVSSEFANVSAERNAEERSAREVSENIRNRLAMAFQRRN